MVYFHVFIYLQGNYFHDAYTSPPSPVTRHLMQRHPDAVVVQNTSGKNPQVSFYNPGFFNPKVAPLDYRATRTCIFYPRYNKHYPTTNSIANSFTFLVEIFVSEISSYFLI